MDWFALGRLEVETTSSLRDMFQAPCKTGTMTGTESGARTGAEARVACDADAGAKTETEVEFAFDSPVCPVTSLPPLDWTGATNRLAASP